MTINYIGNGIYLGLDADVKPTTGVAINALFIETDTGEISKYNGTSWDLVIGRTKTEIMINKTVNLTDNIVTDTSITTGDLVKSNGTKFVRVAKGTAGQVLKVNAGGTDLEWGTGGGGEVNTSSNVGIGEGTLAKTKVGVDLPFKSLKQGTDIVLANNADDVTVSIGTEVLNTTNSKVVTNKIVDYLLNTIKNIPTLQTIKKYGADPCSTTAAGFYGLLAGMITQSSPSLGIIDPPDANGNGMSITTTATNNNHGRRSTTRLFRRDLNFWGRFKWNMVSSTTDSITRLHQGFASITNFTSDTPLGSADSGVLLWHGTGDTNYKVWYNDGTAAAPTPIDTGIALSTDLYTVEIVADNATPKFIVKLFNSALVQLGSTIELTSRIPAATTGLYILYGLSVSTTPHKTMIQRGVDVETSG